MADIVKWLRPRIVVPICVGSNPTIRPIFKKHLRELFLYNKKDINKENESLKDVKAMNRKEISCNLLSDLIITDGAII